MTRVLLLADTHLPKRAKDLPAQVWDDLRRLDVWERSRSERRSGDGAGA